ncbi:MAG: DUF1858 domain-containing protein [Anaerotignum sp.]|nr:DUF1858 domain-containing protein [Anaerotignum sp.]
MKVTKDMTIGELLMMDRSAGMILMQNGMHCVGCPSAAGETLEEASMVHGMNCDKLVADINAFLESK